MNAWIVGGGLAGCVLAHEFNQHGIPSHIFERNNTWGGLLRNHVWADKASDDPVVYEPHGSHIVHTDDEEVWNLFTSHTPFNNYEHSVLTMVRGEQLTWPIQIDEIERVYGGQIAKELRGQEQNTSIPNWPVDPTTMNFESWCLSIMPQEVYDDFVAPYTEKQWGRHPSKLAASFAPKRVQVRTDGDKRLFKDAYQGFPDAAQGGSYDQMLKGLLGNTQVHTRWKMNLDRICDELQRHPAAWRPDFVAITAPLDDFCRNEYGKLDWRGLTFSHKYVDTPRGYAQDAMVVNWPGKDFPFIRTHETKHASGQKCRGTVLTTEFPGGPGKYYPVPRADGRNKILNERYAKLITKTIEKLGPKVILTGRLATYKYLDTDEVAREAMDSVRQYMFAGMPAA